MEENHLAAVDTLAVPLQLASQAVRAGWIGG